MELNILIATAISIGFVHTIIGPDHYLPFVMVGRARGWRLNKTAWITVICGIGHVAGSVILGIVGITLGIAIGLVEEVESIRGDIAGWLFIGFGVAYGAWGLRIGLRAAEHTHDHEHSEETHTHAHHHLGRHIHIHGDSKSITPRALFIVFVLGPCEPLIPILMYPAALGNWWDILRIVIAFGLTTVATMTGIVIIASLGLWRINLGFMERYVHALAGIMIAISGLSVKVFGV